MLQLHKFGMLLRVARLRACMSQEKLAQMSGLSLRTISDLERGKVARPRPNTIGRLADALNLNQSQLQALVDSVYLTNI